MSKTTIITFGRACGNVVYEEILDQQTLEEDQGEDTREV